MDTSTLPNKFIGEITQAFDNLNAQYVAVRSSANREDGIDNSFAGQFDSFLNTTKDNLIENILKCWDSINSPRCQEYLKEKKINSESVKIAVVVQKMIQSEVSGIAFTINPVTNDTQEIMIEAGYGLGEAIVSGQITPDNYLVNKQDLSLNEINVSEQSKKLVLGNKQNTWLEIPENTSKKQKLNKDQIKELANICLKIESYNNYPCDIEWALEEGKFYITQSRPVTTFASIYKENSIVNNIIKYSHNNKLSKQGGNISPLTYVSAYEFFNDPSFKKYYDFDFGSIAGYNKGREGIFFFGADNYKKTLEITYSKLKKTIFELLEYKDWEFTRKIILNYYDKIDSKQIKSLPDNLLIEEILHCHKLYYELQNCTLFTESLDEDFIDQILVEIESKVDSLIFKNKVQLLSYKSCDTKINELFIFDIQNKESLQWVFCDYFSPPQYNNLQDLIKKKQKEVLKLLKQNLFARIELEIEKNKIEIQNYALKLNDKEKKLFDFVQNAMIIRDERKEIILKVFTIKHNLVTEFIGRKNITSELAPFCIINDFEKDGLAFENNYKDELTKRTNGMLTYYDTETGLLIEFGELKNKLNKINNILLDQVGTNSNLKGNVAYFGLVKGKVNKIMSSDEFNKFIEGDVLVTSMTRPEFVPLMKKASAIITDEGGVTCHAAIISRKLKIPCIIGTKIATQVLKDGDLVEVDADNGVVRILDLNTTKYNPDDYITLFSGKSMPVLLSDLFLIKYSNFGTLSMQTGGTWITYLLKATQKKTLEAGIEIYTDEINYLKYKNEFDKYKNEATKKLNDINEKNTINANDVENFFRTASDFWLHYPKTEFFYTDKIDLKKMIPSVHEFDKLKLDGRKFLNKMSFEEDGFVQTLVNKLSIQLDIDRSDIIQYTIIELINLVKNGIKITQSELKKRESYFSNGVINIYADKADVLVKPFLENYLAPSKIINGSIAYKGNVKGRVKILNPDYSDFDNIAKAIESMNQGDILVAQSTSPEIIPAIKKASAIITNQGGVLSHAAIIAREFEIPCIIGTDKDVTQILKDGDWVEVDANNGVIKII